MAEFDAVALTATPFPDGTGHVGVAEGWTAQSLGQGAAVLVGPDGARVELAIFVPVLDSRGMLGRQATSMGLPPTGLVMECIADPAEALVAVTRGLSMQRGHGDPQMKVESAQPSASRPGARTAVLSGTQLVDGALWRFSGLITASPPNAVGSWSIGGNIFFAPDATFRRHEPAMTAMANSMVLDFEARRKQLGLPEGAVTEIASTPGANPPPASSSAPEGADTHAAAPVAAHAASGVRAATGPALQVVPFPDGTGHIGIAEGWIAQSLGQGAAVLVGPDGAQVSMGVGVRALDPRGSAYQMNRQMTGMGIAPPGLIVEYVADPAHAFVAVNSALMMQGGQPDPQMRIVEAKPAAGPPGAMGAFVTATYHRDGIARRVRGMVLLYAPMQNGYWMLSGNLASAPDATYDRDEPTLQAMFNSFSIDHEAIGKQVAAGAATAREDQGKIVERITADGVRARGVAQKSTDDFVAGMFHSDRE
ncbi:MAG: hypothetical protein M3169_17070 [Candidatus Eremiobacteraeota bacterium]|nr:hypothetical protein [Candidatus Eremiobacteraeota bacterium]